MFVKVLIIFVFGVQSVFVTDLYLSFLISLIVMIDFRYYYSKVFLELVMYQCILYYWLVSF